MSVASLLERARAGVKALTAHGFGYPFATNLSLISIPIGIMAICIGQEVSRGFTIVWHRPEPVYVWGVVLLLGGYNVAAGIVRKRPATERAGLFVLASAYAFYGASVLAGLGYGGLVTGPTFLALALSCLQRARVLSKRMQDASVPLESGD
jgi:hypothetical protein